MLLETLTYRDHEIEIHQDENVESPDQWGNTDVFVVYDHRQFCVKREGFEPKDIFEHMTTTKKNFYKGYHVFVLYAYIHSGVALSVLNDAYPFNDRWDVSTTGFILVKKQKGTYTRRMAIESAMGEVKIWNIYLSGDVYGYNSEVGSCWGFYGEDGKEQMITEAKGEIDYELDKENENQLKLNLVD